MAKGTGHGAQLAFATTGTAFAPHYTTIGGYGYDRPALDASHLQTQGVREYLPGDVYGASPFASTYWWEPADPGVPNGQDEFALLFDDGAAAGPENVTMTMPDGTTFAGLAFVTGLEYGEITTDVLLSATVTTQWANGPVKS